ncbi:hypothetical protein [Paenibacillus gansuensis]|uniref:Uncharacterized protein n=1 Tax=Paenibacillus gansuensis TaxID=306542 RepID=A0ABW5PHJ8_9BACL
MKPSIYKLSVVSVSLILSLTSCMTSKSSANNYDFIEVKEKFGAWQGVATDGKNIYVTSDRNEDFKLQNSITVYNKDGNYVKKIYDAYQGKDAHGRFMSFGDGTVINHKLYMTVYNFNSGPPEKERESRIVIYSLPELEIQKEIPIGGYSAEVVTMHKDSYWVFYHDKNEALILDKNYKIKNTIQLSANFEKEGGYQGAFWEGDNLYLNLHGSNSYDDNAYAFGLDHYKLTESGLKYIERIVPPTYGSGQGIDKLGSKYLWVDRPANKIVLTDKIVTKPKQ